jgi:gamma-D-glutamyl-L-lysine dipeptidyl-peptidase
MKILILLVVFCVSISINPQEKKVMNEVDKKLEEIRLKHIPDKRVAVYHIESRTEGKTVFIEGQTNVPALKKEIEDQFKGEYKVSIELLPSKELGDKLFGVINLSAANIRTKPEHSAELATQALLGQPVSVLEKKRGWYLVQTPDNYISWADDDGVELMTEKEMMKWKTSNKIIYLKDYGFSYSEKDLNSFPVGDLVKGNILKKLAVEDEFTKVEYPDKRIAYILTSEAEDFDSFSSSASLKGDKIVNDGFRMMGIPYLWGGTSMKGVDCSGFTKTVFYMNGLILPRDASQQVFTGDPVDISNGFQNLQPGDLLFFGSRATDTTKERVTHVAIYIGDNDFIHSSGRVKVNSLDKSKPNFAEGRLRTLLRAKRIINARNKEGLTELKDLFNINGMQP